MAIAANEKDKLTIYVVIDHGCYDLRVAIQIDGDEYMQRASTISIVDFLLSSSDRWNMPQPWKPNGVEETGSTQCGVKVQHVVVFSA